MDHRRRRDHSVLDERVRAAVHESRPHAKRGSIHRQHGVTRDNVTEPSFERFRLGRILLTRNLDAGAESRQWSPPTGTSPLRRPRLSMLVFRQCAGFPNARFVRFSGYENTSMPTVQDRVRLERLKTGTRRGRWSWRSRIVLLSAAGCGTMEIMRRTGISKPTVWRWQARYLGAGVDGLLRQPAAGDAAAERRHQDAGA